MDITGRDIIVIVTAIIIILIIFLLTAIVIMGIMEALIITEAAIMQDIFVILGNLLD